MPLELLDRLAAQLGIRRFQFSKEDRQNGVRCVPRFGLIIRPTCIGSCSPAITLPFSFDMKESSQSNHQLQFFGRFNRWQDGFDLSN